MGAWSRIRAWHVVVGVAALGLVAGVAVRIPAMIEAPTARRFSRARSDMRTLAAAIESYHLRWKQSPAALSEIGHIEGGVPDRRDPFASEPSGEFRYFMKSNASRENWILISAGPDRDYDIDPAKVFAPAAIQPSSAILELTYDPTNGVWSGGDIWRFGPLDR